MALFLKQQSSRIDYNYREYTADTEADITSLPTTCTPGSTCFVIESSKVYMLNSQKEWIEI